MTLLAHDLRVRGLAAPVLAALSLFAATSAAAAPPVYPTYPTYPGYPDYDATGWYLQIDDSISFGASDPRPDFIGSGTYAPYPGYPGASTAFPYPVVLRAGATVAEGVPFQNGVVALADLHDGDVIVLRDSYHPGTELTRTTYHRDLRLDEPICAGQASYTGSRTPDATGLSGAAADWVQIPGDYPNDYPAPTYPGGAFGWQAVGGVQGTVTPVGRTGITFTPNGPLTVGMRVALRESARPARDLQLSQSYVQTVAGCTTTTPEMPGGGAPGTSQPDGPKPPQPGGSTPTPGGTTAPPKDTKAPVVTVSGLKASTLRKLGLKRLLKSGLPVTLVLDEGGKVKAKISLTRGKKRTTLLSTTKTVTKGKNTLKFAFSKSAKKKLGAASKTAKLRIELTVTDAAGNAKVLPVATVKLPR